MDFIGSHDPHDLQVLPYVVGALADLDLGVLETPRLSDLLLLGRRPGDNEVGLPEIDRLYDRLGSWVLDAESSVEQAEHVERRCARRATSAEGAAAPGRSRRRARRGRRRACAAACCARCR